MLCPEPRAPRADLGLFPKPGRAREAGGGAIADAPHVVVVVVCIYTYVYVYANTPKCTTEFNAWRAC